MIRNSEYATLPLVDVPRGFALGVAVVSAIPQDAPEHVKVSGRGVHARTVELKGDWAAREAVETKDRRPADLRNDRAWSSLFSALDSATVLAHKPRGQAAIEVIPKIFTNGLTFIQLPYEKQWAHGSRLLELIETEGLEAKINLAAGGSDHLDEVRESHVEYGIALNITEPAAHEAAVNLADALGRLRDAIHVHVSQLIAWGNQSESSEAQARAALAPIDKARAQENARAAGQPAPEPDVTPDSPVPPAP